MWDDLVNYYNFGFAERTRVNHRQYLRAYYRWCTVHGFDPLTASRSTLDQYRGHLIDSGQMPRTINSSLSTLRGFYTYLHQENFLATNPAQYLKRMPGARSAARPWLPLQDMKVFLAYVEKSADEPMRAFVLLQALNGLRPQDIFPLDIPDIGIHDGRMTVALRGRKSGHSDIVSVPRPTADAVLAAIGQRDTGPLLINGNTGQRLSKVIARKRFKRLLLDSDTPYITPYGLRVSFVTNALEMGISEREVMYSTGFSSTAMSSVYDRRRHTIAGTAALKISEALYSA